MYMVFGNDERMNEARKLLSVEKTKDVVCVFQPNVKVIKDDTKRIPWGARAYAFDFDEDARRILAEKSVKMIKYGDVEEFKKENSVLTAEGVLIILLEKSKTKISDKRVLVVGNGASGKEIVDILLRLNVKVSVMTSRADSVKSKTSKFSSILDGVTDFGRGITPFSIHQRIRTCAGVFPWRAATSFTTGISKALPFAMGAHASTAMLFALQ